MERNRNWVHRIADGVDLSTEPLPGFPVLEVAGDCRVLMEHHRGVTEYTRERICVRVRFGTVCITGCDLELKCMSKAQLVISGRIDCVQLHRKE